MFLIVIKVWNFSFALLPQDIFWLAGKLGNAKELIKVDHELYNHFDFLWATDNNRVLYDLIISRLPSAL